MFTEYNSKLMEGLMSIDQLSIDETIELIDTIEETKNPIFLYPLYKIYKDNNEKHSSIRHFFISAIGELDSADRVKIGIEIGENNSDMLDLYYSLEILEKSNFFEESGLKIGRKTLELFILEKEYDEHMLFTILNYIEKASGLETVKDDVEVIFNSDEFDLRTRQIAFEKLLKINASYYLGNIIDNFDNIKISKNTDRIIAKTIIGWRGSKIDNLKRIISEKGSDEAKYIIQQAKQNEEEKKQVANKQRNEAIKDNYGTADLIYKICELRGKINDHCLANEKIGFLIFENSETIFFQLQTINNHSAFIKACIYLREFIQSINEELKNHGLTDDEKKKFLPDTLEIDMERSINRLALFLYSRGISPGKDMFGLRQLNQILNLAGAHPNLAKNKFINELKSQDLYQFYIEENWPVLHRKLLEKYISTLENLLSEIATSVTSPMNMQREEVEKSTT